MGPGSAPIARGAPPGFRHDSRFHIRERLRRAIERKASENPLRVGLRDARHGFRSTPSEVRSTTRRAPASQPSASRTGFGSVTRPLVERVVVGGWDTDIGSSGSSCRSKAGKSGRWPESSAEIRRTVPLREPAQRIAARIDELMRAEVVEDPKREKRRAPRGHGTILRVAAFGGSEPAESARPAGVIVDSRG